MTHITTSRPMPTIAVTVTLIAGLIAIAMYPATSRAQSMGNMNTPKASGGTTESTATGSGIIKNVNVAARKITIEHGPMPAVKWPAMKMEFPTVESVDLTSVKVGDKVQFTVKGSGSKYVVQSVAPAP